MWEEQLGNDIKQRQADIKWAKYTQMLLKIFQLKHILRKKIYKNLFSLKYIYCKAPFLLS